MLSRIAKDHSQSVLITRSSLITEMEEKLRSILSEEVLKLVIERALKHSSFTIKNYGVQPANTEICGFMAIHSRVFVCVDISGSDKCLQFFMKSFPERERTRVTIRETGAFKKEIGFYTKILPKMLSMGLSLPYAECYHAHSENESDFLVLEDLCENGYRLTDWRNGIDFEHCAVVLKVLAKFHAASVVLEQRKGQKLNQVYDFLFYTFINPENRGGRSEIHFGKQLNQVKNLIPLMPQFKNSVNDIQNKLDDLYNKASELVKPSSVINVVCHGDIWGNNILFKYGEQGNKERPVDAKLVDLQMLFYSSPITDLLTFFYTNTTQSFRQENVHKLLQIYYESFSSVLTTLGISVPGFTLKFLLEDFNRKRFYGLASAVLYLPFGLLSQEGFQELLKPTNSIEKKNQLYVQRVSNQFQTDEVYRSRLTDTVSEFLELVKTE